MEATLLWGGYGQLLLKGCSDSSSGGGRSNEEEFMYPIFLSGDIQQASPDAGICLENAHGSHSGDTIRDPLYAGVMCKKALSGTWARSNHWMGREKRWTLPRLFLCAGSAQSSSMTLPTPVASR